MPAAPCACSKRVPTFATLTPRWRGSLRTADVTESHTTYVSLVRFRSPRPLSSWAVALLAMLDSAALFLALSSRPHPWSRLGCVCEADSRASTIAWAMGF
jgi:hypothetical protein